MKFLLVTDLDNTLVGDDRATLALNQRLRSLRSQFCLVYATGRSYTSTCELIAQKQLLDPDYLIAGVGSEIYQNGTLDLDWATHLSHNWDKLAVASIAQQFSQLELQSPLEQNPWKMSFFWKKHRQQQPPFSAIYSKKYLPPDSRLKSFLAAT